MKTHYEEELNKRASNPNFSAVSGSRLYGTEVESSDIDIRGFTIPPFEYLVGIKDVKCVEFEGDHKVYSLKRFFELILNGDPMTTELLFCPKDKVLSCDEIGQRAIGIGLKYALSNKSFARIMGYSNGEWRKAMTVKLVPEKKKKHEPEILNDFWNCFDHLTRDEKEIIISTVNKSRPTKLESSMSGLGRKRKAQVEMPTEEDLLNTPSVNEVPDLLQEEALPDAEPQEVQPDVMFNMNFRQILEDADLKGKKLIIMYVTEKGNTVGPKLISPPFTFIDSEDGETGAVVTVWDEQTGGWKNFTIDNITDIEEKEENFTT